MKRTYSTQQVAREVGIHWMTLHRWLNSGAVRPSVGVPMNGRTLWRWTDTDVERVRRYKETHYRKGRGRKKAKKKA
jgi:predicted site-specific integrase-resolvase